MVWWLLLRMIERRVLSMWGAGAGGVEESLVRADNMVREVHVVKGC